MNTTNVVCIETPTLTTHVEAWLEPENMATISISMSGAPLDYEKLREILEKAVNAAKAQGKRSARIFINHVGL